MFKSLLIAREKNPSITFYNDNLLNDYSYIGKVDAIVRIAGLVLFLKRNGSMVMNLLSVG